MSSIHQILTFLINGSAEEARHALKTLNSFKREKLGRDDWAPFFAAMAGFHQLPSSDHQAAFLLALRHPIAALGRKDFERFSKFILAALRHPSGKVRQAAVAAARELISTLELAQFVVERGGLPVVSAERIRRDRRRFAAFLSALESLRGEHCDTHLDRFEYIEELPPSICKSAETIIFEILEDPTLEYVAAADKSGGLDKLPLTSPDSIYETERDGSSPFAMPTWFDCTWKRLPCDKANCPICSRLTKHRLEHINHGDDPQTIEGVLSEMRDSWQDVLGNLAKHLKRKGIRVNIPKLKSPPRAEVFPLARKVSAWTETVYNTEELAREHGALWPGMAAAADMLWYAHMLHAKVYKQLCNKWYVEKGVQYGAFDYEHTKSAISQILSILQTSLQELGLLRIDEKGELLLAAAGLEKLKGKILNI